MAKPTYTYTYTDLGRIKVHVSCLILVGDLATFKLYSSKCNRGTPKTVFRIRRIPIDNTTGINGPENCVVELRLAIEAGKASSPDLNNLSNLPSDASILHLPDHM